MESISEFRANKTKAYTHLSAHKYIAVLKINKLEHIWWRANQTRVLHSLLKMKKLIAKLNSRHGKK